MTISIPGATSLNSPQQDTSKTTIFQHCLEGHTQVVLSLLDTEGEHKHNLKEVDADGRTLLHWACSGKHLDLVNILLDRGFPVDTSDEENWTPLIIAVSVGNSEIVDRLLAAGANANSVTKQQRSVLHYAAGKNQIQIARTLIKHTADVHVQDQLGQTPLHRAASLGNTAFVKMLIEEGGAKINLRDGQGNSALHIAVEFGHGETAVFLLQQGADGSLLNKEEKDFLRMTEDRKLLTFLKTKVDELKG